jgi:sphingolipid delta-4 desaturase
VAATVTIDDCPGNDVIEYFLRVAAATAIHSFYERRKKGNPSIALLKGAMGATVGKVTQEDFFESTTDEPHATRRELIMKKYPEVKKLFGYEPRTKYIIAASVAAQILVSYLVRDASWPLLLFIAYSFGGTVNHAMTLAIHELSHGLGFKKPLHNKLCAIFANLPMGIPSAITFKKYHMEHHRYQGEDQIDVDIPTAYEGIIFCNTALKFIWVILQPLFYSIRPLFVRPKKAGFWEFVNVSAVFGFDFLIFYFFGFKSVFYLIIGTLLGMGVHPVAGHFIAEHYVFVKGQETYSYYGPLNWVTFNVGYHNEHHDFPRVPGSRLPLLRKMAPEFYDTLPHHTSWTKVIYDYITDPAVGPFSRIKRQTLSEAAKGRLKDE